jgi:hypothetical protein
MYERKRMPHSSENHGRKYVRLEIEKLVVQGQLSPKAVHRPGFEPRSVHVGFLVDKAALGQVSYEYFGFPCNSHSTDSSTFIFYQPGLVQ